MAFNPYEILNAEDLNSEFADRVKYSELQAALDDLLVQIKAKASAEDLSSAVDALTNLIGEKASADALNDIIAGAPEELNTLAKIAAAIDNDPEFASAKQETLVSGENIKTINGQSLLGSDNIALASANWLSISAGGDLQPHTNYLIHFPSTPTTFNLPADPVANTSIRIAFGSGDPVGSAISAQGKTIMGSTVDLEIDVEFSSFELVYIGGDWRVII